MRRMQRQVIHIQPLAPAKPAEGAACNGCGVCCLAEPCPLGRWLSRRRSGVCEALAWDDAAQRYRCGVLQEPARWLGFLPARWARALAGRWIAAGRGCDCSFEAQPAASTR